MAKRKPIIAKHPQSIAMFADQFHDAYFVLSEFNHRVESEKSIDAQTHLMKQRIERDELVQATIPQVMSLAFSLELYLKAILGKLTGQYPVSHNVNDLFLLLPSGMQKDIKELCRKLKEVTPIEFDSRLKSIEVAFEKWRYAFEEMGVVQFFDGFALVLAEVLRQTYRSLP